MDISTKKALIEYLSDYATDHKLQLMYAALAERTRYVVPVLEDVYQAHNISAAMRSAEGFGVQDVHVIEQNNRYREHIGVSMGASKWIDIHRYNAKQGNNVQACFSHLRAQGYRIVATSPHERSCALSKLPLEQKIALVFGTEETGISDEVRESADQLVHVPMYGFTESFNISVSVALCLYDITTRLRATDTAWQFSDEEKTDILLQWLRKTVRASKELEKLFFTSQTK